MRILFVFGANLNMLGQRGEIYGDFTYLQLKEKIINYCNSLNIKYDFFLSNHEGEIIDRLQNMDYDALVINCGGYSHYSLAIADTLKCIKVSKIEVHLTNIHSTGRHTLVTGAEADGVICGFKDTGYLMAIDYIIKASKICDD